MLNQFRFDSPYLFVYAAACPQNTYKDNESTCLTCPENSRTSSTGNNITGCQCLDGFNGPAGGPCSGWLIKIFI